MQEFGGNFHTEEWERTMLTVTMLQTPRVELDGREIVFPFKRVDALFYYMVVRRSATRQELIALLWESCDDATGLKNLRNTVYSLKKVLGGDFLLSPNKTTLQVNPDWELDCDYDHFMREGDLSLYRGDFLQGFAVKQTFSFDIWMERTRDALRERYLMLLFRAARAAAEEGQEERAVLLASDYLREEPCDETVACFLMERFRLRRSYPRAAEVYQRLRDRMEEELGTAPQRRTTELYYQIMDEWDRDAAASSEPAGELSGDALFAARLLAIFQGQAGFRQLLALSDGQGETLSRGLKRLLELGMVRKKTEDEKELWRFPDGSRLEAIAGGMSFQERQQLHRRAAQVLLEGRTAPTGELCRAAALQYQLAGDGWQSMVWRIRGLDQSSARCCEPSPVVGSDSAFLPGFDWAGELRLCQKALEAARNGGDEAELARMEQLLTLSRGRIALFTGNWDQGSTILGGLTGRSTGTGRDSILLLRSCILLASNCISRQKTSMAERYVTAAEQLAARRKDAVWPAVCLRLRGSCLHLRGEQDRALYYLSEAADLLERQPDSAAVRLQMAAVREAHGCVMLCKGDYVQASHSFRLALEALAGDPWVEEPWLCVHYGRTAYQMADHSRARQLFERARQAAHTCGTLWGLGAASAYLAYYSAQDERYESAANYLREAADAADRSDSALEKGIVQYISMLLRSRLDLEGRRTTALEPLLPLSAEAYARQGVRQLSGLHRTFEADELSRGLREGILTQSRYRAAELYSRERHFMTE